MALINSIGAGIYTTFSFVTKGSNEQPISDATAQAAKSTASGYSFSGVVAGATTSSTSVDVDNVILTGTLPATGALTIGGTEYTYASFTEDSGTYTFTLSAAASLADNAQVTAMGGGGYFANPNVITNIREFPSFGTPANIVNVPAYGQSTSSQIQGQSDAPTFELTVNYVPGSSEWTAINNAVSERTELIMEVNIKNGDAADADNASFWVSGQLAAVSYSPNLTDSNQATITVLVQSDFTGPFADA